MKNIFISIVFIAIVFAFTDELGIIVFDPLTSYCKKFVLFERKDRVAESPYKYEIMLCHNCVVYIWFSEGFFELSTAVFGVVVQLLIEELE